MDSLLDKFMGLDESQRQQVIKWAAIAASVGPAILVYGKVSNALGTFVTGIGKFATAVGKAGAGDGNRAKTGKRNENDDGRDVN